MSSDTGPCPAGPGAQWGGARPLEECGPLRPYRGPLSQQGERRTCLPGQWQEIAQAQVLGDGWQSIRLFLAWPRDRRIDWLVSIAGPLGEQVDWGAWYSDGRAWASVCLGGISEIKLLARPSSGAAVTLRCSWWRYPYPEPVDRPPLAGSVLTRLLVPGGGEVVIPPVRGQRFASVQVLSPAPSSLLLAEGPTTAGGTLGDALDGAPAGTPAGGFYEGDDYAGELALFAPGAACLAQVVQR